MADKGLLTETEILEVVKQLSLSGTPAETWMPSELAVAQAQDIKTRKLTLQEVGKILEKYWGVIETRWAYGELASKKHNEPQMKQLARISDELKHMINALKRGEMPK